MQPISTAFSTSLHNFFHFHFLGDVSILSGFFLFYSRHTFLLMPFLRLEIRGEKARQNWLLGDKYCSSRLISQSDFTKKCMKLLSV